MNRYHIATILGLIFWLPIYAETKSIKGSGYTLTQERKTDSFYNIEAGNHISVYIVQGPFGSITVEADNNLFSYIKTEVRNKTLQIFIPDSIQIKKFTCMNILISLPNIYCLSAKGQAQIHATPQIWQAKKVKLVANEGGKIHLSVHASEIDVIAETFSTIDIKGISDQLQANLNTTSTLFAKHLSTNQTTISLNNGAKAEIQVNQSLHFSVSNDSKLIYKGDPKLYNNRLNDSGKIIHLK